MEQVRVEERRLREALVSMATEWSGNIDRSDEDLGVPVSVFVSDLLDERGSAADAATLDDLIDQFAPPAQKAAAHLIAQQLGEIWGSTRDTYEASSHET